MKIGKIDEKTSRKRQARESLGQETLVQQKIPGETHSPYDRTGAQPTMTYMYPELPHLPPILCQHKPSPPNLQQTYNLTHNLRLEGDEGEAREGWAGQEVRQDEAGQEPGQEGDQLNNFHGEYWNYWDFPVVEFQFT